MATTKESRKGARRPADPQARAAAVECARAADGRRGSDVVVLYVEEAILITDFFVLVTARNKRQIQAIASDTADVLKDAGYPHVRKEGFESASWVLVDAGPVVVHIFREDLRGYYDLELLWGDAPKIDWHGD